MGLGKKVTAPALHVKHVFLTFAFSPLTSAEHWVFSLAVKHSQSWGMGNTPGCSALVKAVSPALVASSHPLLLPMGAHKMILTQQDLIPVSQDGLLILKEIKSDFRALVPIAAMMFPSCILPFCCFIVTYIGEVSNTVCHLISVVTEVAALHLTQLSKFSQLHCRENPEQPEKSWKLPYKTSCFWRKSLYFVLISFSQAENVRGVFEEMSCRVILIIWWKFQIAKTSLSNKFSLTRAHRNLQ